MSHPITPDAFVANRAAVLAAYQRERFTAMLGRKLPASADARSEIARDLAQQERDENGTGPYDERTARYYNELLNGVSDGVARPERIGR